MNLPATSPTFAILISLLVLILVLTIILLTLLYRRRAHNLAQYTLQSHHRRYRHLDTQTCLVTAASKDCISKNDVKPPPAELDTLSKARKLDVEIWELLSPWIESGKGPGRKSKKDLNRKLVLREELGAEVEELHKEILCRCV